MTGHSFLDLALIEHARVGPLGPHLDDFLGVLLERGYAKSTAKEKIRIVSRLSKWLESRHLTIKNLNESTIKMFLSCRKRKKHLDRVAPSTFRQFLSFLREEGIVSLPVPAIEASPLRRIERGFAQYLVEERGLSQASVDNYSPTVRRFLTERFGNRKIILNTLCPQDISAFIIRHAHTMSPGRAQLMVTALRSFFRFLLMRSDISTDLAAAVPTVARWRFSGLPKFLEPEQVERLLKSCNRNTASGQRDFAVLLLLSRLGLRAGEIVHLVLDDILWESGELIVRGKSAREERLPLPHDVGEAVAAYLRYGRPHCTSRRVFIRIKAPRCGFATSAAVDDIVRLALSRADIDVDFKGAHLLRHTLATTMLRGGASFTEIGEILRHQLPSTTEVYAKVDLTALRTIAQPWPGGEI